ncbi:hypothetical protein TcasGA2_TC032887 [Tribolium castaneum]|uniref:Uncharacterized protein n=1 Tax=Tribolium castaneum TaxID=7070 RepID=A0A139WJR5_TRICA|nr:hypothetical protein TcasGA2_TC032887 [Tribolium castaneum]
MCLVSFYKLSKLSFPYTFHQTNLTKPDCFKQLTVLRPFPLFSNKNSI